MRVDLIKKRMRDTKSHHKSYTNGKKKHLEFVVSDLVYIKISLMKGVRSFRFKEI